MLVYNIEDVCQSLSMLAQYISALLWILHHVIVSDLEPQLSLNDLQTKSCKCSNIAFFSVLVLKTGGNTSSVYRFKLQDNRYVFVQTKSKLFTNKNNGDNDFVMSTHSIIRECDTENELKGSASSSLMKSIIGNSPLVSGSRNNQNIPAALQPNNNLSMMMATMNPQQFMGPTVSPSSNMLSAPLEETLDLDLFTSNSWDASFPSDSSQSVTNSVASNGNNNNFNMVNVSSSASANMNAFSSVGQMKMAAMQQQQQQQHQHQRQLLLSQQQQQMVNKQQMQMNFQNQRSNSFESGQKSPGFSPRVPSKNNPFPMPGQRNMMGFPSQRSPGSAGAAMGQNRMSPGASNVNMMSSYPLQRTSPVSTTINQNNPLMGKLNKWSLVGGGGWMGILWSLDLWFWKPTIYNQTSNCQSCYCFLLVRHSPFQFCRPLVPLTLSTPNILKCIEYTVTKVTLY